MPVVCVCVCINIRSVGNSGAVGGEALCTAAAPGGDKPKQTACDTEKG